MTIARRPIFGRFGAWARRMLLAAGLGAAAFPSIGATGLLVIEVDAIGIDKVGAPNGSYLQVGRFTLIDVNTKKGSSFLSPMGVQVEELEEGTYCLAEVRIGFNLTFDFCEKPYIQVIAGKTVNAGHWQYGISDDHRNGQRRLLYAHTSQTLSTARSREPEKLARYPEIETPTVGHLVLSREIDFAIKPATALDQADQARLRAFYEGIPATDTPPYPVNGVGAALGRASMRLTDHLPEDRLPFANVLLTVNSLGKVVKSEVLRSSSRATAQTIIDASSDLAFVPPVCAAGPCTMEFPVYVRWQYRE